MSEFTQLQLAMANWPDSDLPRKPLDDSNQERLRQILCGLADTPDDVGPGDIAGAVRHVLRRETLRRDDPPILKVPRSAPWPERQLWVDSQVEIVVEDEDSFRLRASENWQPDWLENTQQVPPLVATFKEEFRRRAWPVETPHLPLDSALKFGLELEFANYLSPGQRQAIHAAFLLRPGGTLVVNLPTGTGKSLVAWAPALLSGPRSLTVMITPTVALGLDQERQLHENYPNSHTRDLPRQLMYHADLQESERREFRRRITDGTQRILITSPESLVRSLRRPLFNAARAGQLQHFVVDEAHLVAQWGNEFRPEFQSMSGLRRELLKECPETSKPFKTFLLSATLTQNSLDTLRSLFSESPDTFDMVSAISLRPEPTYWISKAQDNAAQDERIEKLIRVVPRPFLLYVSTLEAAKKWHQCMPGFGIQRCGKVDGSTSSREREKVIDQWRSGGFDCVVATSAFGLGMDKSDVRTVIHACMPESVDRYYQEVGRGGRGGCAAVSILVHSDEDFRVAESLSNEKVIGIEKGLQRWEAMLKRAVHDKDNDRCLVKLDTKPATIEGDTEANEDWNLRTLNLLNRANFIRLESHPPPTIERKESEIEKEFEIRREKELKEHFLTCPIKIIADDHSSRTAWEKNIEPIRLEMLAANRDGIASMKAVLSAEQCISEILCKSYTLDFGDQPLIPEAVCAGCPSCRSQVTKRQLLFRHPEPAQVSCLDSEPSPQLSKWFRSEQPIQYVACPNSSDDTQEKLLRFVLPPLVRQGISEIAVPETWRNSNEWKHLYRESRHKLIIDRNLDDFDPYHYQARVPRVTCFLDRPDAPRSLPPIPHELVNLSRPWHVLFAWSDTPHRDDLNKKHFDVANFIPLDVLLRRMQE